MSSAVSSSNKPLIHVTEALKAYTLLSLRNIREDVLATAMQNGTDCHTMCAAYGRGEWMPNASDPHFLSYKKWYDSCVSSTIFVEHTMTDPVLGITGTLDLYCILNDGRYALIDIKRSASIFKTYYAQVAAYRHLLKPPENTLCGVLPLKANGRPAKLVEIPNIDYWWGIFLNALNCYRAFIKQ